MPNTGDITRRGAVRGPRSGGARRVAVVPALAQGDPAQAYPSKPIRIVVGFGPGGGNDIFARLIGQKLSERLGQPVLVENKPGAGAVIATDYVAKSPPDGYTLLVGATGAMTISPAVYSKLPYVTLRDFVPLSMIASFPLLVTVNAAAPVKDIQELVAYAKANPAKANYASSSPAFQLATEQFKQKTGAPLEHIAYKSSGEMLTAVVSGEVLVALADAPPVSGHLKAGRIRALAVTSAERIAEFPDVPTMARSRRARSRRAAVVGAVRARRHARRHRQEAGEGADGDRQAARRATIA